MKQEIKDLIERARRYSDLDGEAENLAALLIDGLADEVERLDAVLKTVNRFF